MHRRNLGELYILHCITNTIIAKRIVGHEKVDITDPIFNIPGQGSSKNEDYCMQISAGCYESEGVHG